AHEGHRHERQRQQGTARQTAVPSLHGFLPPSRTSEPSRSKTAFIANCVPASGMGKLPSFLEEVDLPDTGSEASYRSMPRWLNRTVPGPSWLIPPRSVGGSRPA